jgi:hypothetical protein
MVNDNDVEIMGRKYEAELRGSLQQLYSIQQNIHHNETIILLMQNNNVHFY